MGRRGPAPTPTPVLRLRGSGLVTKRREQAEVKGPAGVPDAPAWLDADGKAMWDRLLPQLESMGVLTTIDENALARYCRMWVRWRSMEDFIDKHGVAYPLKDEHGRTKFVQQWPQVSIASKLSQALTRLEAEFGMTPSARARIQLTANVASEDPFNDSKARFFEAG